MKLITRLILLLILVSLVMTQPGRKGRGRPHERPKPQDQQINKNGKQDQDPRQRDRRNGNEDQQQFQLPSDAPPRPSQQEKSGQRRGHPNSSPGYSQNQKRPQPNMEERSVQMLQQNQSRGQIYLIKFIVVVVICLLLLTALLILKPFFLRKTNKQLTEEINMHEKPPQIINQSGPINNIVIIQKQITIQVIKQKFLSRTQGRREQLNELESEKYLDAPQLQANDRSLTPTFGDFTFRNKI